MIHGIHGRNLKHISKELYSFIGVQQTASLKSLLDRSTATCPFADRTPWVPSMGKDGLNAAALSVSTAFTMLKIFTQVASLFCKPIIAHKLSPHTSYTCSVIRITLE
jgi:hypothetical protein